MALHRSELDAIPGAVQDVDIFESQSGKVNQIRDNADRAVVVTTRISQMNIEIDPGPTHDFYTASFNDLSLVTVPEPATLAASALACVLFARRRR